jgi:hypothetical protein
MPDEKVGGSTGGRGFLANWKNAMRTLQLILLLN